MSEVWNQASLTELQARPICQMRPEHLFIFLALHLSTQHEFERLIWVRDLREMLLRPDLVFDWAYFVDCVDRWQLRSHIYFCLTVTGRLTGVRVPLWVLEETHPRYLRARIFEHFETRTNFVRPGRWSHHAFSLFSTLGDNARARIRALATLPSRTIGLHLKNILPWRFVTGTMFWGSFRRFANNTIARIRATKTEEIN